MRDLDRLGQYLQYSFPSYNMISASFPRSISQPVAGITLFAFMAAAFPFPCWAQLPIFEGKPTPFPTFTPTPGQTFQTLPSPPPNLIPEQLLQINSPPLPNYTPQQQQAIYTLGGGDVIRIDVFSLPQFSGQYSIPADGFLSLPLVGSVSFDGLTIAEATATLVERYKAYLKRPLVTVNLLLPRPVKVLVAGEVKRPGSYIMPLKVGAGESPGTQYPSLTQAIELAEGVTLAADLRQVELRRQQKLGAAQTIKVNLWELANTGHQQDVSLRDGDTIFVPTSTNPSQTEIRSLTVATFSTDATRPVSIAIVGEVNRPGNYTLAERGGASDRSAKLPSITRAIKEAGGIKPFANIRQIEVRRLTRAGTQQIFNVDLWQLLQTGDINQDLILQDGDTVIRPTATAVNAAEATQLATANFSPDTIQVSVVGEVGVPGFVKVPPNTPLNQAVLAAGGFKSGRADTGSVSLVRLNPDGTVVQRTIKINFSQGINEEGNPMLRNNDIVLVSPTPVTSFTDAFANPAALGVSLLSLPLQLLNVLNAIGIKLGP